MSLAGAASFAGAASVAGGDRPLDFCAGSWRRLSSAILAGAGTDSATGAGEFAATVARESAAAVAPESAVALAPELAVAPESAVTRALSAATGVAALRFGSQRRGIISTTANRAAPSEP